MSHNVQAGLLAAILALGRILFGTILRKLYSGWEKTLNEAAMKAIYGLFALSILGGCQGIFSGPPEVDQCEKYIRAKLENPGSYKRVQYASLALPYPTPEYWEVGIDYSFVSASNKLGRGSQLCDFPLVNGKPDTSKYVDFDHVAANRKLH